MKHWGASLWVVGLLGSLFAGNATPIPCGALRGFACGDVNGDGKADLVLCANVKNDSGLWIFLQKSDGSFDLKPQRKLQFPGAKNPQEIYFDVAIADLDGDGKNDIIADNYNPAVYVFWGKDNFKTTTRHSHPSQWRPQLAVVPRNAAGQSWVAAGAGLHQISGFKSPKSTYVGLPPKVKGINQRPIVGDVNLDGHCDLIFSTYPHKSDRPGFNIYYGPFDRLSMRKVTRFNEFPAFSNIKTPQQLNYQLADVNGDGTPDLVYGEPRKKGVWFVPQDRFDGFKNAQPQFITAGYFPYVLIEKFTGEQNELAVVTRTQIQLFTLPERKLFKTIPIRPIPNYPNQVKTCDLDGDRKLEILLGDGKHLWIVKIN